MRCAKKSVPEEESDEKQIHAHFLPIAKHNSRDGEEPGSHKTNRSIYFIASRGKDNRANRASSSSRVLQQQTFPASVETEMESR